MDASQFSKSPNLPTKLKEYYFTVPFEVLKMFFKQQNVLTFV